MEEIGDRVHEVLRDPTRHVAAQAHYREVVQGQRDVFRREVQQLLEFAPRQTDPTHKNAPAAAGAFLLN